MAKKSKSNKTTTTTTDSVVDIFDTSSTYLTGQDVFVTKENVSAFRESGRRYKGNLWVYEVKDNGRWVPDGTGVFFTRDEARVGVTSLRNAGLNVRIAKYSVNNFDRF